ncbi:MAG: TonB-dependent receptor, partial [Gemmatimonadetes bacterium]|nr:TonB-dependent receptor [Gemmatimonadota bacterium]
LTPQLEGSLAGGSDAWRRLLLSGSDTWGGNGVRADLNVTHSGGYRDDMAYDRVSGTVRWDAYLPANATLRTTATYSAIDQTDGSTVPTSDYQSGSPVNYNPISFRRVNAFRLVSAFERPFSAGVLSLTPYVRHNTMEILPSWMLSYDPVVYTSGHNSAGLLAKLRYDLPFWEAKVIGGVDLEYSPGFREENVIAVTKTGAMYGSYTEGARIYDYDVAFRGASPYLQADLTPLARLGVSLGVRYDHVGYDYDTHLEPLATGRWRRPADTQVRYDHLSPKLGATYELGRALNLFGSYRHGFRAPSEGQLFRQGSSINGPDLKPVRADSWEAGARGSAGPLSYEASAYRMDVRDDILTYQVPAGTGFNRVNVNAGHTRHAGVELALGVELFAGLRLDGSYSNAVQRYLEWTPSTTESYDGKRIESAPRVLANTRLSWTPRFAPDARVGAEWVRVGSYFLDPANTHTYPGHDLFNLRLNVPVTRTVELDGRITNLFDTRYADSATYDRFLGEQFMPGAPRSLNLAVQYRWQR